MRIPDSELFTKDPELLDETDLVEIEARLRAKVAKFRAGRPLTKEQPAKPKAKKSDAMGLGALPDGVDLEYHGR